MTRAIGFLVGLFILFLHIPSAQALTAKASIKKGAAAVKGSAAAPNSIISWDDINVATSNKRGTFKFSATVPDNCVGKLSDGVTTIWIGVGRCTGVGLNPAPVPQTGQTTSYAVGDDGSLQEGVGLPKQRFTDNSNGTITDNLTGLIWLRDAFCGHNALTWQGALDFVAAINAGTQDCGDISNGGTHQTDWRLPNVRELQSLVDYGTYNPALPKNFLAYPGDGLPFENFSASYYWSSTTHDFDSLNAWIVDFNFGFVGTGGSQAGRFVKTDTNNVIAVRGGQ